jgi:hypothetical protein
MTASDDASFSARLQAIEDRLAIIDLLAGSALSSDVASAEFWQSMFTTDAEMDRGDGLVDRGLEQLLAIVGSPGQASASDHGMAHLAALPHIVIDGDTAFATGYLLIVIPGPPTDGVELPGKGRSVDLALYHLTVNRWDLIRTGDGWKVTRRTIRPLGREEARTMIDDGIAPLK